MEPKISGFARGADRIRRPMGEQVTTNRRDSFVWRSVCVNSAFLIHFELGGIILHAALAEWLLFCFSAPLHA
jgi:hypothetical protein